VFQSHGAGASGHELQRSHVFCRSSSVLLTCADIGVLLPFMCSLSFALSFRKVSRKQILKTPYYYFCHGSLHVTGPELLD
jgi:hypothetical protein